jgi:hypothetical protein
MIAPSVDGFLAYDVTAQLLRRYDARGNLLGAPAAMLGVRDALGLDGVNVVAAPGRLALYDTGGRLRREALVDVVQLVALPGNRFAAGVPAFGEVRIYGDDLRQIATLRPQDRAIRALAVAPDGALAVLTGSESCVTPNDAVELYPNVESGAAGTRIVLHAGGVRGIAIDANDVYVAEPGCRGANDGVVAVFGRDGSAGPTLGNVDVPLGVIAFPGAQQR